MLPFPRSSAGKNSLEQEKGAAQVYVMNEVPLCNRVLVGSPVELDTGIVAEGIHLPKVLKRLFHQGLTPVARSRYRLPQTRPVYPRLLSTCYLHAPALGVDIRDHDLPGAGGETVGDRLADPACPAGYHNGLHGSPFKTVQVPVRDQTRLTRWFLQSPARPRQSCWSFIRS